MPCIWQWQAGGRRQGRLSQALASPVLLPSPGMWHCSVCVSLELQNPSILVVKIREAAAI